MAQSGDDFIQQLLGLQAQSATQVQDNYVQQAQAAIEQEKAQAVESLQRQVQESTQALTTLFEQFKETASTMAQPAAVSSDLNVVNGVDDRPTFNRAAKPDYIERRISELERHILDGKFDGYAHSIESAPVRGEG